MQDNKLIEKEIKTGLVGDTGFVEILSGLKDGEEVYLSEDKE
jgi:hypothetical protein